MFTTLFYLNYALRRNEFSHPDIKLGLIRLLGTKLCRLAESMAGDDSMRGIAKDIVFKKYFPYQISQVSILYQFKAIYLSCPLRKLFECQGLIEFIDSEIKRIETKETAIENSHEGSTNVLEKISSLKHGKFDYSRKPKLNKEEQSEEEVDFKPN